VNEPVYFHQFIERAAPHGLAYLGEANFATMLGGNLSPKVNETLARMAPDVLKREQFIDFLHARTFRETLLIRNGIPLVRKVSPKRVMGLRVASKAKPVRDKPDLKSNAIEEFKLPDGPGMTTPTRLTKAAMLTLVERWPVAMPFDELEAVARERAGLPGTSTDEERERLADEILHCYIGGVLELHYAPSPFATSVGDRPVGSALARLQAQRGGPSTSLRHEHGTFHGDTLRLFLLLDGTRTRAEIARLMWPGAAASKALPELDAALRHLARLGLMVG